MFEILNPGTLFIILFCVVLFVSYGLEKIPFETVSLFAITILAMFGYLFSDQPGWNLPAMETIFKGFANSSIFAICGLLIIAEALAKSGIFDYIARIIVNLFSQNSKLSFLLAFLLVLLLSSIINNIPVVIMFIPIILGICARSKIAPSKVMMKMAYLAVFGGMITLIGSSTNLLVNSTLINSNVAALTFFEFTLPGLIMAGSGFIYVFFFMDRLLPDNKSLSKQATDSDRNFLVQAKIKAGSPLLGSLDKNGFYTKQSDLLGENLVKVKSIILKARDILPPFVNEEIIIGDEIIVALNLQQVEYLVSTDREAILPVDFKLNPKEETSENELHLVELIILPLSNLIGRTISKTAFASAYGCHIIGFTQHKKYQQRLVKKVTLSAGDTLLAISSESQLKELRNHKDLLVAQWSQTRLTSPSHYRITVAIAAITILSIMLSLLPIHIASILGACAMLLFNCLSLEQAFKAIDRKLILLIVVSIAIGETFQATGSLEAFTEIFAIYLIDLPVWIILTAFYFFVAVCGNIITTKATAIIFTPVALVLAEQLNLPYAPFIYAVIFAANSAFAYAYGYQTNLLVIGPGNYKFKNFLIAGLPLIIWSTITFAIVAKYII